jgi:cyclopropane-fatty-acyl-phospholipid synthase
MDMVPNSPRVRACDTKEASSRADRPRIAMALVRALFIKIVRQGTLKIIDPSNQVHTIGQGGPEVTIRIKDQSSLWRIAVNPDMAIGEAFVDGRLTAENGDIYDFLDLCLSNVGWLKGHWIRDVHGVVQRCIRRISQYNPLRTSRRNVAHHYDLTDSLYGLFLDKDRQYSCGYFREPDDTIERAQSQKMRHLAAKLLLRPGQRVLDIGSGWGGLAINLAQQAEVDVTGITLSAQQHKYASRAAIEADASEGVRFLLKDYREVVGKYDRIVSVGMFEHVGVGHYRQFFEKVRDLLTDDGVALIHTIGLTDGPAGAHPWMRKYIFPGAYSPALSEVVPWIERAGLYLTDIEVLRLHYAETLKAWRRRFLQNRDRAIALYDERFARMWEFYLAACEASFRHSGLVVYQFQLSMRIDAVPITRDYIQDYERDVCL